jgi:multiple inositol-polyphosphate phosphatase/2,3-bisphosphoglycerate 3-phosphatase
MAKLLARWGLYKDVTAPTASNFAFMSGRQWSTSRMQNFGVNMVFVLFRCELNSYKVQLYVNERLTHIPGCATDTCLFSEFAAIVQPIIETCDLDAICENPPAYVY